MSNFKPTDEIEFAESGDTSIPATQHTRLVGELVDSDSSDLEFVDPTGVVALDEGVISVDALIDRLRKSEQEKQDLLREKAQTEIELTRQKDLIERLEVEALCDSEIGFVLNKRGMRHAFEDVQKKMSDSDTVILIFLDINFFKEVNERISHTRADMVIAGYADHLVKQVRRGDAVARMGGDEFAIVVNLDGIENVDEYMHRIASPVRVPYDNNGVYSRWELQSSVGYTKIDKNTSYREALLAANDSAVAVKQNGRDGYAFKSPGGNKVTFSKPGLTKKRQLDLREQ